MVELQQQLDTLQQQNISLQQQLDTSQQQNISLQQELDTSQEQNISSQQQLYTLQQQNTSLQQQLYPLQQQVYSLQQELDSLQPELDTLQQQNTSLQQQLNASQRNQTNLQQQLNTSQEQLSAAQIEPAFYKKQLDEMSEKYQKLSNASGIEKIRDLFKQLTSPQIDALHTHTNFQVDTFETVHIEQQVQCSSQFVQSILTRLKSSVDAVIQLQKNTLAKGKQAKESVIQSLTTAGVSKATIDASIKPVETEIEQIEAGIEGWNRFSAILIDVMNHLISTSVSHNESKAEAMSS